MPDKCVVFGCNNRPSKTEGISLHPIPFEGADEPEKRKRRKKWVDFIKSKRAHWEPTKYSTVCSKHFRDDDYEVMFPGLTNGNFQRRLRKDEIGICVFPTIQAPCVSGESKPESKRAERKVRKLFTHTHGKLVFSFTYSLCICKSFDGLQEFISQKYFAVSFFIQRKKDALESPDIFVKKNVVDPEPKRRRRSKEPVASSSYLSPSAEKRPQAAEPVQESEPPAMCEGEGIPAAEEIEEGAGANQACASCVVLRNEKRKLGNTVKSLRKKLVEKRKELTKMEKKLEGKSLSEVGYVTIYMKDICSQHDIFAGNMINGVYYAPINRELEHRRFGATDVNRKSRLLLFDAYYTLVIQIVKL